MGTFYVGDLHLGHRLVAATRGFFAEDGTPDTEAHDEAVVNSILETVPKGSVLRLLGDNSANNGYIHALSILSSLKYYEIILELIYGNHDKIHAAQKGIDYKVFADHVKVFSWMGERLREKKWGRSLYFSHYPSLMGNDSRHKEAKDALWRWPIEQVNGPNDWIIHAHTHQSTLIVPERPNHVCVSWDVLRRPVSESELKRVVLQQERVSRLTKPAHWGDLEVNRARANAIANHEVRI